MIGAEKELAADRLLTIQEAADRLRISRWLVYNLIRANQLRTIKIGRRRLVTPAAWLSASRCWKEVRRR